MPRNQQSKKGVFVLAWVINPNNQADIEMLLYNGGKEEYVWNTGVLLECVLVLLCPVIKVNGKLKYTNLSRQVIAQTLQKLRFLSLH